MGHCGGLRPELQRLETGMVVEHAPGVLPFQGTLGLLHASLDSPQAFAGKWR